jgi:hypothetical protein
MQTGAGGCSLSALGAAEANGPVPQGQGFMTS